MEELLLWWSEYRAQNPDLIWEPRADSVSKKYGQFLAEFGHVWREHGSRVLRLLAADREQFLDKVSQAASVLDEWWAQVPEAICASGRKAISEVAATGSLAQVLSGRTLPTPDDIDDEEDLEEQLAVFQMNGRKTLLSDGSQLCKAISNWASGWKDRTNAWSKAALVVPPSCAIGAQEFASAYCGVRASGLWRATEPPTESPWNSLAAFHQAVGHSKSEYGHVLEAEASVYGLVLDHLWARKSSRLPSEVQRLESDLCHNRWTAGMALCLATSPRKISGEIEKLYKPISQPKSPFFEFFKVHPNLLAPHWIAQLRRAFDWWATVKLKGALAGSAQDDFAHWNEIDDLHDDPPFVLSRVVANGELVTREAAVRPTKLIQFLLDCLSAEETAPNTSRHRATNSFLALDEDDPGPFGIFEIQSATEPNTGKQVVVGTWIREGMGEDGKPRQPIQSSMSKAWIDLILKAGKKGEIDHVHGATFKKFASRFEGIARFIVRAGKRKDSNSFPYSARRVVNCVADKRVLQ